MFLLLVVLAGCGDKNKAPFGAAAAATATATATTATTVAPRPTTTTTAPRPTTTTARAGFRNITNAQSGFSLSVPSDWKDLRLDGPELNQAVELLKKDNPKLVAILEQARGLVNAGGKVFAVDMRTGDSVNVLVQPVGNVTVAEVWPMLKRQFESLGAKVLSNDQVAFAGGEAMRVRVDLTMQSPVGAITGHVTQYITTRHSDLYVLTLTGSSPALDTIAKSLVIT